MSQTSLLSEKVLLPYSLLISTSYQGQNLYWSSRSFIYLTTIQSTSSEVNYIVSCNLALTQIKYIRKLVVLLSRTRFNFSCKVNVQKLNVGSPQIIYLGTLCEGKSMLSSYRK